MVGPSTPTIKYVPGKDGDAVQRLDVSVHEVYLHLIASPIRVGQIREETAKDATLSAFREVIMSGWPEKRSDFPTYLHAYWNYRDELTVADGLILKGTRIIIPNAVRRTVILDF